MSWLEPVATSLLLLHAPDGREIRINPDQVTSLRSDEAPAKKEGTAGVLHGSVRCMVSLADGKFVAVVEPCNEIAARLRGEQ